MVRPSERKQMACNAHSKFGISIRFACSIFKISQGCFRYTRVSCQASKEIAQWMIRLTNKERRWGFGLCFDYLRNVLGKPWNHKKVYRIYRELELNLRIKPRRRLKVVKPETLSEPRSKNVCWSIDFMHDDLNSGRSFRTLNVLDDFRREGLRIKADFSLPSARVIRVLEQVIEERGKPQCIRCDNGPEFVSKQFQSWASRRRIRLVFIQPGKPQQNAYVERFNRTVREEFLNQYLFESIEEVQDIATQWLWSYNNERPHTATGGFPPQAYNAKIA